MYNHTLLLVLLALTFVPTAPGITLTVDSTGDAPDAKPGDGICATSQGACTLRAAIEEANALPGPDVISFNAGAGACTITPASALPSVSDPVVIDGATQPGYSGVPLIELDGSMLKGHTDGLTITAGSSTVRGLVIHSFSASGIRLSGEGGNVIQGNWIGIDATGSMAMANEANGVLVEDSPNNHIGGTTPEARNVISGNLGLGGIALSGPASSGNVIQGNFIGTNAAGTAAIPNDGRGIAVQNAPNNLIGGTVAGARNIISGNRASGIRIFGGSATGNVVQGNYVGADVTGKAYIPNSRGLQARSNNNVFGGPTPESANLVVGNTIDGIVYTVEANNNLAQGNTIIRNGSGITSYGGTGNSFLSNTIYANVRRGIDLGGNGVTPNDAGDFDSGANNLQNFPVLSSAKTTGSLVVASGTLNSAVETTFRIQFFTSNACDPSGYGEGQRLIGEANVTTDSSGNASFQASLLARVAPGNSVTATATDPGGNTSEFSACVPVTL